MTRRCLQRTGRLAPNRGLLQAPGARAWSPRGWLGALLVGLAALIAPAAAAQVPNSDALWSSFAEPTVGAPQVIGTYTNGCIGGAQSIALEGPGHVVIRPQRNRYWGHPSLIAFVNWLSEQAHREGLGVLMIADLGQPRGGPVTGHASHEMGLDVDIWLQILPSRDTLSPAEVAAPQEVSFVVESSLTVDRAIWTPAHVRLYQLAASYPGVERIFAHPALKQALCADAGVDRAWLNRVRPWYGHTGHMHVRLACPADSPQCRAQAPVPPGDGCGAEVDWWLAEGLHQRRGGGGGAGTPPPLPAACAMVMQP